MRAAAVDMCSIVIGSPNVTNEGDYRRGAKHSTLLHVQSLEHNTAALCCAVRGETLMSVYVVFLFQARSGS